MDRLLENTIALERTIASRQRDQAVGYLAIELQNTWSQFARSFFLACAFHATRGSGGRIATTAYCPDERTALALIIPIWRPSATLLSNGSWHRRDEPAWHDPNVILKCLTKIGASNLADVQAGLSSGSRALTDLPVFRNFFAHRNRQTEAAAMKIAPNYGIPATFRPSRILLERGTGRPHSLLRDWVGDIRFTIQYLCS